jgi:GntR family transcriptional regulator
MPIQIDFRSDQPIYVQIVEQIRQLIATGKLKQGDQLPTVRQLAADLRVNFNTVARAYRLLDEAGLISTQQGRGTYIWRSPSREVAQRLRQQSLQELTLHYIEAAQRLGFQLDEVRAVLAAQFAKWNASQESQQSAEGDVA